MRVVQGNSILGLPVAVLILAFLLAAVSDTKAGETVLRIEGSDRLAPLVKKLGENYSQTHPDFKVEVKSSAPNAAVFQLAAGKCDIALVDRPLRDEEIHRIRNTAKKEPVAIPIAMDAVVMLVHPENPLDSLTLKQVAEIWSYKVRKWPELGVPFEDKDIKRIGLEPDSGAIDIIVQRSMGGKGFAKSESTKFTATDVANEVTRNKLSVGFASIGDFLTAKMLPIRLDDSSPPIKPSLETVKSRKYPLAQYLYLVFPGEPSGTAKEFMSFAISTEGQLVVSSSLPGPIPLPFAGTFACP